MLFQEFVDFKKFVTQWEQHPKKESFIDWVDDSGIAWCDRTMLMAAMDSNRWDIVEWLLNNGADFTIADKARGFTPLIAASKKGHLDTVSHLLNRGADPDVTTTDYGYNSLMFASQKGHTSVVKALVSKGANINATKKNGTTALELACSNGYIDIVKIFLENDADLGTAVQSAAEEGYTEIVKLLVVYRGCQHCFRIC